MARYVVTLTIKFSKSKTVGDYFAHKPKGWYRKISRLDTLVEVILTAPPNISYDLAFKM